MATTSRATDNIRGLHLCNLWMPEILRIAFATPEYVTEDHFDGGLANYINRIAKLLADRGHDVHVVTLSLKNEDHFEHEGVMVHRVMLKPVWHAFNRATRYSLTTTLHWLNFSTQAFRKLKQLHREHPFHLIQYPNYSFCGLFSIPFLRSAHVVRASSYQPAWNDIDGVKRNLDSAIIERLEGLQYKLTRNVFAPSNAMQKTLTKNAKVRDARVIRTPFYVETREWDHTVYEQYLTGKKYALYFGRFQLHKGFHTLAQALPRFLSQCPDAYVVCIGRDMETSLASSMAGYARALCGSSAARLVLLDNLPHSQLYPVIAGAQFIVLPSLIDNSPNACLEAMGLGKVVIGTSGTSFDELITDRVNGFLVPPADPVLLAEKMISAWTDTGMATMAEAAKQRMQEFAPEKTVASLLSYYSEILHANGYDRHQDQKSSPK
ncbi:MAG TPA: glycosyltransferase family 4 protein [Pyrinomonadaceae bacterium]|nr:glycosyltransferase family 4 protein [Pyrinomonadaceae bacterium]